MHKKLIVTIAACLVATQFAPQLRSDEIVTDRPDQTESAAVVPVGSIQIEIGGLFSEDDDGTDVEVRELLGTLLRFGIHERTELRLGWAGNIEEEPRGMFRGRRSDASGLGDAELGAKIRLNTPGDSGPNLALLISTSVPVGEEPFTSDRWDPAVRIAASHELGTSTGLGYNLGIRWASEPGPNDRLHTVRDFLYTVALGHSLGGNWGAFVELFGELALSSQADPRHSIDGGITYLLSDSLQLDLYGGVGVSDAATDRFLGIGLSFRIGQ